MSKRLIQLINNQAKVKVIAATYDSQKINTVWLMTFAAAVFTVVFYFFSLFFGFARWRVLTES